ncbi:DUF4177 domain-containing protein [Candidatus Woesearchaeota archaeon]|nr:DUF4177 domain-containing protein [Candidatus Woesearchaeota archaeon]
MVNRCAKCDKILNVLESGIEYALGNQTLFLCRTCNNEFETKQKAEVYKESKVNKFEYKVVKLQGEDLSKEQLESELNFNGQNSWELISVLPVKNLSQSSALVIFKRNLNELRRV